MFSGTTSRRRARRRSRAVRSGRSVPSASAKRLGDGDVLVHDVDAAEAVGPARRGVVDGVARRRAGSRTRSSFQSLAAAAITRAPSARATSTPAMPSAPPAPMTSTVSPAFSRARIAQQVPGHRVGDRHRGGLLEADALGGIGSTELGRHATRSASPPSMCTPTTRWSSQALVEPSAAGRAAAAEQRARADRHGRRARNATRRCRPPARRRPGRSRGSAAAWPGSRRRGRAPRRRAYGRR